MKKFQVIMVNGSPSIIFVDENGVPSNVLYTSINHYYAVEMVKLLNSLLEQGHTVFGKTI